jgi:hypothetical protein
MSSIVYRIATLLEKTLKNVPIGTNLALWHLCWTILTGRLLPSRGALFPALQDLGLDKEAVRRADAALCYGRFDIDSLLKSWQETVLAEGHFRPHVYEGVKPVSADLIGFFRPQLQGAVGKHYHSLSDKALPAVSVGLIGAVGSVGEMRFALPRAILTQEGTDLSESALKQRLLGRVAALLKAGEAGVFDSGFEVLELWESGIADFVVRGATNFSARRNFLPPYKGAGRPPKRGEVVRPLARSYKGKETPATAPDATARWKVGKRTIQALIFKDLVPSGCIPGDRCLQCVVILDPKYKQALVLVSTLKVSAYALWRLYLDRWPIEVVPLSAKQMLGAERAFVFGEHSRVRLPVLSLLCGNMLSYVAASSPAVSCGFWDVCARPTCGRLRRVLSRLHFWDLPSPSGRIRKKESVSAHLPKGVKGHRRQKAASAACGVPLAA